jgi:hypothetical protein
MDKAGLGLPATSLLAGANALCLWRAPHGNPRLLDFPLLPRQDGRPAVMDFRSISYIFCLIRRDTARLQPASWSYKKE